MSFIMLSVIDDKWKDHLYDLDHLKASISFRGWGQKDPLVEYKQEAYEMFVDLMTDLRKSVAQFFFRAQFGQPQPQRRPPAAAHVLRARRTSRGSGAGRSEPRGCSPCGAAADARRTPQPQGPGVDEFGMAQERAVRPSGSAGRHGGLPAAGPDPRALQTNRAEDGERKQQPVTAKKEPGRNDPCPCGSGKKYKKCHGR